MLFYVREQLIASGRPFCFSALSVESVPRKNKKKTILEKEESLILSFISHFFTPIDRSPSPARRGGESLRPLRLANSTASSFSQSSEQHFVFDWTDSYLHKNTYFLIPTVTLNFIHSKSCLLSLTSEEIEARQAALQFSDTTGTPILARGNFIKR